MEKTNPQMLPPWWNDGLHGLSTDPNGKAAFFLRETNGAIFMENLRRKLDSLTDHERKAYEWAMTWPTVSYRPIIYAAALPVRRAGYELPDLRKGKFNLLSSTMAYYQHSPYPMNCLISINITDDVLCRGEISDDPEHECVLRKWWTQPNVVLHELGHAIADQAGGYRGCRHPQYTDLKKYCSGLGTIRRNTKMYNFIKTNVSEYGATKWSEFDAEVISGILAGKKYPKKIIDLLPNFPDERFIKIKKQGTREA